MTQTENKRVKEFAKSLIKTFGYTFQVPSKEIAKELRSISYVTVNKYLSLLCNDGYVVREMTCRKHGWRYKFSYYKIDKLLSE